MYTIFLIITFSSYSFSTSSSSKELPSCSSFYIFSLIIFFTKRKVDFIHFFSLPQWGARCVCCVRVFQHGKINHSKLMVCEFRNYTEINFSGLFFYFWSEESVFRNAKIEMDVTEVSNREKNIIQPFWTVHEISMFINLHKNLLKTSSEYIWTTSNSLLIIYWSNAITFQCSCDVMKPCFELKIKIQIRVRRGSSSRAC